MEDRGEEFETDLCHFYTIYLDDVKKDPHFRDDGSCDVIKN